MLVNFAGTFSQKKHSQRDVFHNATHMHTNAVNSLSRLLPCSKDSIPAAKVSEQMFSRYRKEKMHQLSRFLVCTLCSM